MKTKINHTKKQKGPFKLLKENYDHPRSPMRVYELKVKNNNLLTLYLCPKTKTQEESQSLLIGDRNIEGKENLFDKFNLLRLGFSRQKSFSKTRYNMSFVKNEEIHSIQLKPDIEIKKDRLTIDFHYRNLSKEAEMEKEFYSD